MATVLGAIAFTNVSNTHQCQVDYRTSVEQYTLYSMPDRPIWQSKVNTPDTCQDDYGQFVMVVGENSDAYMIPPWIRSPPLHSSLNPLTMFEQQQHSQSQNSVPHYNEILEFF